MYLLHAFINNVLVHALKIFTDSVRIHWIGFSSPIYILHLINYVFNFYFAIRPQILFYYNNTSHACWTWTHKSFYIEMWFARCCYLRFYFLGQVTWYIYWLNLLEFMIWTRYRTYTQSGGFALVFLTYIPTNS